MTKAPKTCEFHFSVKGSGTFPTDMLRYDNCRAASPEDQAKIDWTYEDPVPDGTGHLYHRSVDLIADAPCRGWRPTERRWESFLWRVQ